ncbi:MAG: hypothetical protein HS115_16795 [Spirochaetales bacterium]|nr:hypothetical protein [Spirochaetales bacterium]
MRKGLSLLLLISLALGSGLLWANEEEPYDSYDHLSGPDICLIRLKECEAEADNSGMKARCSDVYDRCQEDQAQRQKDLEDERAQNQE